MGRTSTPELRLLTTEPSSNVYQPLIDEIIAGRRNIFGPRERLANRVGPRYP